jgi:uncharacterized protein Veg
MEVIKSAIREASGQRLGMRRECGRQAAAKEWGKCDEYARKLYLQLRLWKWASNRILS